MPDTDRLAAEHAEVKARVDNLESKFTDMTTAVKDFARSTELGFERMDTKLESLHKENRSKIDEWIEAVRKMASNVGRPNYNALGVAFAVVAALLGWYVRGQVDPIIEALRGETEARRIADTRHDEQRTEDRARQDSVNKTLFENELATKVDVAKLQTWEEARKLWVDRKEIKP